MVKNQRSISYTNKYNIKNIILLSIIIQYCYSTISIEQYPVFVTMIDNFFNINGKVSDPITAKLLFLYFISSVSS